MRPDPGGAFDDRKLTGFGCFSLSDKVSNWIVLCAAKDETSVDIMGRKLCCNFLRKSRL
jgi:hypothetical protein